MNKPYLLVLLLLILTRMVFCQQTKLPISDQGLGNNHNLRQVQESILSLYPQFTSKHNSLEFLNKIESLAATHYTFRQLHQGIPLYQKGMRISTDREGNIRNIGENLADIPKKANLDFSLSVSGLQQNMAETYAAYQVEVAPMFYEQKGTFIPIYQLICYSHGPVYSFEVLLHAKTGEELSWESLDLHLKPSFTGDTTGRGRVFNPNPCTQAQVNYGDLFIDSLDFHKSIFDTLMDTVTLQGLCFEADSFRLKGPYVEIKDLEAPAIPPLASADGDFFYKRDEYGFEQVMAYYHIDNFQRHIRSLGFLNLSDGPVLVDAQGTFSDNSVTTIKDSVPSLLFGLGGVDDAEDADVIIHEYGHALSYYATKQRAARGNIERLGLEEGIGDYLAAIYSQDQGFENWPLLFNWDGHNEFWNGRIANSPATYPPTDTTIYTLGSIWAATLLELRELLGQTLVDSLFFEELYMNTPTTNMTEAAQLFLLADSLLFQGAHVEEISFIFCGRGLLPKLSGNCAVVSNTPLHPLPTVSIFPNPANRTATLTLESEEENLSCSLINGLGQEILKQAIVKGENPIEISQLPPGIYFVKILNKHTLLTTKKLLITQKK